VRSLAAAFALSVLATPQVPAQVPAQSSRPQVAVVVASVGGLTWERPPPKDVRAALDGWAVGAVVPVTARRRVCPADLWLSIGSDARAYVPGSGCPVATVTGSRVDGWEAIVRANEAKRFGATPGSFAESVGCLGATGPLAALAAAHPDGRLDEYASTFGANTTCDHQVADLSALRVPEAVAAIDAAYDAATVVLVGIPERGGHYGAVAVRGSGSGLVEGTVPDLVLPRDLAAPLTVEPADDPVPRLVDLDRLAYLHRRYAGVYFTGLIALPLLLYIWLGFRRRAGRRTREVAYALAALPVAGFLCSAVPWWRSGLAGAVCVVAVAASALVVSAAARLLPLPRGVAIGAVSAAVFAADLLTGGHLQRTGLASWSSLNGGRYFGLGNVGFAVFTTGALLALLWVLRSRWRLLVGLLPVAALDAVPRWGADFGGAIALGAAWATAAARRASRVAVAGGAVAGLALALGVALLDWSRPEGERTHLGHFVHDLFTGGWTDTVLRKAGANLHALTRTWYPLLVAGSLLVAVLVLRRLRARGDKSIEPFVRPLAALWLVGSLVNDSGVMVAAVGLALAVPALVAYAAERHEDVPW
jgi:hypothetical protein